MANRLADATSPYLLQHRNNPVHWQPWDAQALGQARAEDKPILLSVGYAACHWCHVMAHESFESAAIAEAMNRDFVSIKVDREERPDLDAVYQQALALLGQQGGWPLTMFLTPAGEPFWGGTYFPPEQRYGRAGFPQVLETVARIWRDERHRIEENTRQLTEALGRLARPEPGDGLDVATLALAARRMADGFDTINGGLGGAPKFPNAPIVDFVWRVGTGLGDPALTQPVVHSLERMSQGGIWDHLGGGFARYAVDAFWLVPHFEKMLYDNAQLLELLARAQVATGEPLFAARARETVAWLEREMVTEAGGFASSLDADSAGEEGRFYVWTAEEVDAVLGDAAPEFKLAYGVRASGNWEEGKNVLNRLHARGLPEGDAAKRLAVGRAKLLAVRARRVRPGLDDKVLADWNGMMIAALAEAAGLLDEPGWLAPAERAFAAIVTHMSDGDGLVHSWRAGRRLEVAFADDYAQMIRAALALFEATGKRSYLEHAERWAARLEADHGCPDGGWFTVAAGTDDLPVRARSAQDGPHPSANGTLVGTLARLAWLSGKAAYRERAEAAVRAFAGSARQNPFGHGALMAGALMLERPVQVVLIGAPDDPNLLALRRTALKASVPERLVLAVGPDADLPADHPAAGKTMSDGRATAYVCIGPTCRAPVDSPEALAAELAPEHWRLRG